MNELTRDEHKRAQEAFNTAMIPGMLMCSAGMLLHLTTGVRAFALLLCVGGVIALLAMGFSARRREIEAIWRERERAARKTWARKREQAARVAQAAEAERAAPATPTTN